MNPHRKMGLKLPTGVGFIMDGSGRWGRSQGIVDKLAQRLKGHERGVDVARRVSRAALHDWGIPDVFLWVLAENNIHGRPHQEIAHILKHCKIELRDESYLRDEVHLKVAGDLSLLNDPELEDLVHKVEERTRGFPKRLTLLLAYDGEREGTAALRSLIRAIVEKHGEITPDNWPEVEQELSWQSQMAHAWTAHLPYIDLLIRTGSEADPHTSGTFLPFKLRDTQFIFHRKRWPEYTADDLAADLAEYSSRERRLGGDVEVERAAE